MKLRMIILACVISLLFSCAVFDLGGREPAANNVSVRFNGGGKSNKLYIGHDNLLEFMVRNDRPLNAMSLGFEFTISRGEFSWVEGHGNVDQPAGYLAIYPDVFNAGGQTWAAHCNPAKRPDSLLIGGVVIPDTARLPINDTMVVIYSMLIRLPDNPDLIGEKFCIDNIYFPPAGNWLFTNIYGSSIVPDFQNHENTIGENPDAPPVCFKIARLPK